MTCMSAFRKIILITVTCVTFNLGLIQTALAVEDTTISEPAAETESENKNDQTRIDRLAELSGKSKEEIQKMRTEQNMGWGEIAKSLGVKPSELGQAVRNERKERNAQRKLKKDERKEQRKEERKEDRKEQRAEAKEKRSDRKSEREAKK